MDKIKRPGVQRPAPKVQRSVRKPAYWREHDLLIGVIMSDEIIREDLRLTLLRELDKTEALLRQHGCVVEVNDAGEYVYRRHA